jgi:hypothetical protein
LRQVLRGVESLVLRIFRLTIVIGVLAWAIMAGDLSQRARGFVATALGSWDQSIER